MGQAPYGSLRTFPLIDASVKVAATDKYFKPKLFKGKVIITNNDHLPLLQN